MGRRAEVLSRDSHSRVMLSLSSSQQPYCSDTMTLHRPSLSLRSVSRTLLNSSSRQICGQIRYFDIAPFVSLRKRTPLSPIGNVPSTKLPTKSDAPAWDGETCSRNPASKSFSWCSIRKCLLPRLLRQGEQKVCFTLQYTVHVAEPCELWTYKSSNRMNELRLKDSAS